MRSVAAALILGWLVPAWASAQEGVLVIDFDRQEADAALATHLAVAMREAAAQVPGWRVEAQDPSLADAMAAASCQTLDEACLGRIALAQQAERVIWGRVLALPPTPTVEAANEGGGSPLPPPVEQRLVEIRVYRAGWQTIELTMSDRVPAAARNANEVLPRVRTWIERIAGRPLVGRLVIHAASEDAEVLIDGEQVLSVEDHAVVAQDVPAGRRRIEVRIPGQYRMRREVTVVAGQEVVVEAEVARGEGGDRRRARARDRADDDDDDDDDEVDEDFRPEPAEPPGIDALSDQQFNWFGWGLSVGGGVILLTWAATVLRLHGIGDDTDFVAYRESVPLGRDACVDAENEVSHGHSPARIAEVQDLCGEADFLEVLQWVLLLGGAGALGTGIYILATDDSRPAAGAEAGVQLRTHLGPTGGHLAATIRF